MRSTTHPTGLTDVELTRCLDALAVALGQGVQWCVIERDDLKKVIVFDVPDLVFDTMLFSLEPIEELWWVVTPDDKRVRASGSLAGAIAQVYQWAGQGRPVVVEEKSRGSLQAV